MHAVVRGAVATALLTAISTAAGLGTPPRTVVVNQSVTSDDGALSSVCPKGSLPDATHCVPFPESMRRDEGPGLRMEVSAHRDRTGQWLIYEQIPRRPDRPADYASYQYPVERPDDGPWVLSGYDLDRPDLHQRRGYGFDETGHGGIDLAQRRGAPVRAIRLPHQQGDAEVVFVGTLFGNTVVTLHTVAEAGRNRAYLLIHGHLDAANPKLGPGANVADQAELGVVGDSGSEGRVHLHLEVRQVRDGVDPSLLRASSLADRTVSIVCDPRNVLPMAAQ